MAVEELPKEFKRWTQRELAQCYQLHTPLGEINAELFQRYPEYFELTLDVKAMIRLKPSEYRAGKYPITFPTQFFKAGSVSLTNSTTQGTAKMEDSESIVISDEEAPMS